MFRADFHPDGHYKAGSDADVGCHRGEGNAGYYGLEKSNCDTPISLVSCAHTCSRIWLTLDDRSTKPLNGLKKTLEMYVPGPLFGSPL
jgi:hypothetical protein